MGGARAFAWLLSVAACNQAFGLDRADPAVTDRDGDHVDDTEDNCPDLANEDQDDVDGDGVGTVCDLCPTVATVVEHDEDHDTVGDACDVCPGLADFGDDVDADGVGDGCEYTKSNPSMRLAFDPFMTIPPTFTTGAAWVEHGDEIGPAQPLVASDRGLEAPIVLNQDDWAVAFGVRAELPWQVGDFIEVVVREAQAGTELIKCRFEALQAGTLERIEAVNGMGSTISPSIAVPRIEMIVHVEFAPTTGMTNISCNTLGYITTLTRAPKSVSVRTSPNIWLRYFEAVQ